MQYTLNNIASLITKIQILLVFSCKEIAILIKMLVVLPRDNSVRNLFILKTASAFFICLSKTEIQAGFRPVILATWETKAGESLV